MHTGRSIAAAIALAFAMSAVVGGPVVVPDTYHDIGNPARSTMINAEPVTTPDAADVTPDTYHDI